MCAIVDFGAITPRLDHHHRLKGVRGSESNRTRAYDIPRFEGNIAHLHIPFVGSDSGISINKRYDEAGIELKFQHSSIIFRPSENAGASSAIVSRWHDVTEQGRGNVFVFLENTYQAIVDYRVIPEAKGLARTTRISWLMETWAI
ncbi:hypothetical protein N7445_003741 [Penicillium cf. griseofulvum]|nr:hypothetical protein N7445_003741 [Penicillium cf. griseofulvum]